MTSADRPRDVGLAGRELAEAVEFIPPRGGRTSRPFLRVSASGRIGISAAAVELWGLAPSARRVRILWTAARRELRLVPSPHGRAALQRDDAKARSIAVHGSRALVAWMAAHGVPIGDYAVRRDRDGSLVATAPRTTK